MIGKLSSYPGNLSDVVDTIAGPVPKELADAARWT